MPSRKNVVVFLSHSHTDRDLATRIQAVLERRGAQTFLDQDQIQAGDALPKRIHQGIANCDVLLLLWSMRSSRSRWVRRELETALDLGKKVVPYALDATPLPHEIADLVFVEEGDATRAHAGLLRAIFGSSLEVDRREFFPGRWQALVEIPVVGQATYDLSLRANGQLEGVFRMLPSGFAGDLAALGGATSVLTTPIPLHGRWTYESVADMLTLTITARGYGAVQTETVRVTATGRERGDIQGTDVGGRLWTFSRSSESGANAAAPQPSLQHARLATELQRQYGLLGTLSPSKNRAAEVVFVATSGYAFQELGLAPSELARLTGTSDMMNARVTDELLDFLVESRLLRR
jgi:hypothetical protein